MKNKKPYKYIINRIYSRTLISFTVAVIAVMLLRAFVQGHLGSIITNLISNLYGIDWNSASTIYFNNVRHYFEYIVVIFIFIAFALIHRIFIRWFSKYFDEITEGINAIGNKETIQMSPELDFIKDKLTSIMAELERSREAERELENKKNDLVVYLAHDIKTPLTSVIGYMNLIHESKDISPEQREKYQLIALEKARNLEKLVNEIFEIAQYNLNSVPLMKADVDLSYMMVQIVDEAYPLLQTHVKKVTMEISDDITVYADSDKMARVFTNILKNAIHYSQENSTIEIQADMNDNQVEISFTNVGVIPKDELNNIFNKFYRIGTERPSGIGGAGLGLAIAKDIVALHNGSIEAYTDDTHTTFSVKLPAKSRTSAE